jgi:hypothetical protein
MSYLSLIISIMPVFSRQLAIIVTVGKIIARDDQEEFAGSFRDSMLAEILLKSTSGIVFSSLALPIHASE